MNLKNNHLFVKKDTIIAKTPQSLESGSDKENCSAQQDPQSPYVKNFGLQNLLLSGNKILGFPISLMENFPDIKTIEFDYAMKQVFNFERDGLTYSELMKNVKTPEEKNIVAWMMHKKIKYSNNSSKANKIMEGLYLGKFVFFCIFPMYELEFNIFFEIFKKKSALSAKNKHYLKKKKITGVISLLTEYQPRFPDYFQYRVVQVEDNLDDSQYLKERFLECCTFIEKHINFGGRCLVHCQAGRSRSATSF